MRIVILTGGSSPEAPIARQSAQTLKNAISEAGYSATVVELLPDWTHQVAELEADFVFLGLHGAPGENGELQKVLEQHGVPYHGTGAAGAALAFDKAKARQAFTDAGLHVARGVVVTPQAAVCPLPFPCMVKPASGGSSQGMSLVKADADWPIAVQSAAQYGEDILVEEFITGPEYTVALWQGCAIGALHVQAKDVFFTEPAKYQGDGYTLEFINPTTEKFAALAKVAETANACVQGRHMTRVDMLYCPIRKGYVVLEVNVLPGLQELYPKLAAQAGLRLSDMCREIIGDA